MLRRTSGPEKKNKNFEKQNCSVFMPSGNVSGWFARKCVENLPYFGPKEIVLCGSINTGQRATSVNHPRENEWRKKRAATQKTSWTDNNFYCHVCGRQCLHRSTSFYAKVRVHPKITYRKMRARDTSALLAFARIYVILATPLSFVYFSSFYLVVCRWLRIDVSRRQCGRPCAERKWYCKYVCEKGARSFIMFWRLLCVSVSSWCRFNAYLPYKGDTIRCKADYGNGNVKTTKRTAHIVYIHFFVLLFSFFSGLLSCSSACHIYWRYA